MWAQRRRRWITLTARSAIDLQGKTVLPGMGDSHLHFFAFCQTYTTVDLGGATSRAEALQLLRDRAAETPKGEWIKGSNFDQSKWKDCEDQLPTRLDLDEASTEHPIVIKRVCLHTAVANTMALEKANITTATYSAPAAWWSWCPTADPTAFSVSRPPRSMTT